MKKVIKCAGFTIQAAGLTPIDSDGVENVNLTKIVGGHIDYLTKMDQILAKLGLKENH